MFSRAIAMLVAPWLPFAALMLPLGATHRANALIAGSIATLLSAFSLAYNPARMGAAVLGAWVALTAFIFPSTLLEEVVAVSWGVTMFAFMAGPFSDPPRSFFVPAPKPAAEPVVFAEEARRAA
jgi:hypothetical protein